MELPHGLTEERASALFEYVMDRLPSPRECDHTLRLTSQWCEANQLIWHPIRDWLQANGGFCDCEVMLNVWTSFHASEGEA